MDNNHIGEIFDDYKIVDTIRKENGALYYKAVCQKCGHERTLKYADIKRHSSKHSFKVCKTDFLNDMNIGDYSLAKDLSPIKGTGNHVLHPIRCNKCGNVKYVEITRIQDTKYYHNYANCGEIAYRDNIGKVFDDMEIIDYMGIKHGNKTSYPTYKCRCRICGRIKYFEYGNLTSHKGTTHHACSLSLDRSLPYFDIFEKKWADMRTRTTSEECDHYHVYGGRGIDSDQFKSFVDFFDLMYGSFINHVKEYGIENTTLERINVNEPYCLSNCKWATWEEQFDNKQKTIYFKTIDEDGNEEYYRNVGKYEREHGMCHNYIYFKLNGEDANPYAKGLKYVRLGYFSELSPEIQKLFLDKEAS